MGIASYRIKIGLYVFVIILVGILFGVRVYNTFQKTTYLTTPIFKDGNAQISLSHPIRILSPRNESSYLLTLAFVRNNDALPSSRTYTVTLESPTLLFLDAQGTEITPHFQFTGARIFTEQSAYVRPYLSGNYPQQHRIFVQVVVDEQNASPQPSIIKIRTEPKWFSFFSLAASSLLEISIASALIAWIANAIDASSTARKERVAKIREALSGLSSLSYLEQMDKVYKLEDEIKNENLDDDVGEEIQRIRGGFREEEFFRALGERLRQDNPIDFSRVFELHNFLHLSSENKDCLGALEKILVSNTFPIEDIVVLMKLWDKFDADAKDLIVGALKRLAQKVDCSSISAKELQTQVFANSRRRRLLRDAEIKKLFPQSTFSPSVGYDAKWLSPKRTDDLKILNWLKEYNIDSNPFGVMDLKSVPFYPEGFWTPNQWSNLINPISQHSQCLTPEDARALTFQLRAECLPTIKRDVEGNEIVQSGRQVFPVLVLFNQSTHVESPFLTIARSAAQTWLDILCLSPDAMLDLLPAEQEALLELLCWAFGSTKTVTNLLQREGLKPDGGGSLLLQKIERFQSGFSSTQLPQNAILLSWLKIRPPDLDSTYLIILLDEIPTATKRWWLEQFTPLISDLFLNGIITKAFSSSPTSVTLPLPEVQLNWSDKNLEISINSQFEAAMNRIKQKEMGQVVDFRSLFGSDPAIGYFATEEETTDKLIATSNKSLARLLALGNRLFQYHCEHRIKDGVPEKYLYVEDLETILKTT